jgi:hypothetical protein
MARTYKQTNMTLPGDARHVLWGLEPWNAANHGGMRRRSECEARRLGRQSVHAKRVHEAALARAAFDTRHRGHHDDIAVVLHQRHPRALLCRVLPHGCCRILRFCGLCACLMALSRECAARGRASHPWCQSATR